MQGRCADYTSRGGHIAVLERDETNQINMWNRKLYQHLFVTILVVQVSIQRGTTSPIVIFLAFLCSPHDLQRKTISEVYRIRQCVGVRRGSFVPQPGTRRLQSSRSPRSVTTHPTRSSGSPPSRSGRFCCSQSAIEFRSS